MLIDRVGGRLDRRHAVPVVGWVEEFGVKDVRLAGDWIGRVLSDVLPDAVDKARWKAG